MKTTYNHGQKRITEKIKIKEPQRLQNKWNIHRNPGIWRKPAYVNLPAGTEVDYVCQETMIGCYHEITWHDERGNDFVFTKMVAHKVLPKEGESK